MSRFFNSILLGSFCALSALAGPILAQDQAGNAHNNRRTFVSPHFVMYTDLPAEEARRMLDRMEQTMEFAAAYWRCEPVGRVECYVAAKVETWPDAALPNPLARIWIGGVGGATTGETLSGRRRQQQHKATLFAAATPGVAEHEVIHAYCCQTFGATGPEWYKEGMAELASFGLGPYRGVNCPPDVLRSLRQQTPRCIADILEGDDVIAEISQSLSTRLGNRPSVQSHLTIRDWTEKDADNVMRARRSYFWSWSLCHFLMHNPNYADRFQALGDQFLSKSGASFEDTFASQAHELVFEYNQMIRHLSVGYRVDLCRWEWEKRSQSLVLGEFASCDVLAARGYQATGCSLAAGQQVAYQTDGAWSTMGDGALIGADGNPWGRGRLMAVILNGYELGQPFALGAGGVFESPSGGDLYVRCDDCWSQLHDNRGQIRLRLRGQSRP